MKPTQEDIDLAKATEKQLGLPDGALVGFVAEGGKLDGKRRAKVLDAYGIDAKLNRRNTIEAAGLALQDALSDNGGDPSLALAELYSGADRAKWNKATTTFATRALGTRAADGSYLGNRPVAPTTAPQMTGQRSASGTSMTRPAGNRSASGMTDPRAPMQAAPTTPSTDYGTEQSIAPDQTMAPESVTPTAAAPNAAPPMATMNAPTAAPDNKAAAGEPEGSDDSEMYAAYSDGRMTVDDKRELERLVGLGALVPPAGFKIDQTAAPTTLDRVTGAVGRAGAAVSEMVTGANRRTTETEAAPDFYAMPEFQDFNAKDLEQRQTVGGQVRGAASALTGGLVASGTPETMRRNAMFAAPEEIVQVMQANYPGTKSRQDENGNWFVTSSIDGKEYAIKPGFRASDLPRVAGGAAVGAASAASGGIVPIVGAAMAGQAGVEAYQAASGGNFDAADVGLAGAASLAAPVLGAAARGGRGVANALLDNVPGSTTRQLAGAATDAASTIIDDPAAAAVRSAAGSVDDVTKVVPPPAGAVDDVTKVVPPPTGAAAAKAAPPILETADIAEMLVNASKKGPKSDAAKQKLAELAAVDPKIAQAADDLGIALPVDMMSRNEQFKNLVGLARSKIGSEAQAELAGAVDGIVKRADELVKDFGAVVVEGSPSSAAVSGRVLSKMQGIQSELKSAASAAHDAISEVIPKATKVDVSGARAEMQKIVDEVGNASLSKAERQLQAVLDDPAGVSYQAIKRQKDLVGKAIGGQESPYSNMAQGDLRRLYGLIAQAQEDAVRSVGGAGLVSKLQAANKLTVAQKDVEERILAGFGREGNGDLADKMTRAITAAKSEKSKPLDDLLEIVPEEMHREVIGTAVAKMVSGKDGVFSPEKFVDFYQGMRANPAATARVFKVIGGDVEKVWRDLFEVSKAVATAKPKVKFTGIGNQDLDAAIVGNGLIGKVIQSSVGRRAATAGVGAIGFAAGGPAIGGGAGFLASSGLDALVNARASVLPAMGKLFSSPEFKAAAIAAGSGAVDTPAVKQAVRAVVASKPFRDWAKAAMLPREPKALEQWAMAAIQGARGPTTEAVTREAR